MSPHLWSLHRGLYLKMSARYRATGLDAYPDVSAAGRPKCPGPRGRMLGHRVPRPSSAPATRCSLIASKPVAMTVMRMPSFMFGSTTASKMMLVSRIRGALDDLGHQIDLVQGPGPPRR